MSGVRSTRARIAPSALLLSSLLLSSSGCAGLIPEGRAAPAPECVGLDRQFLGYGYAARAASVVGMTATLASFPTSGDTQLGLRIGAVALGVSAGLMALLQAQAATRYVRVCTADTGVPPAEPVVQKGPRP